MTLPSEQHSQSEKLDKFGAVASSLCALHCAICALLPAAFGALGLGFLLNQEAEWGLSLFAIAFAAGALLQGWRIHRSTLVMGLMSIGIVGLLASRGLEMGSSHDHHGHGEHDAHSVEADHHDDHHGEEAHGTKAHAEHQDDPHAEGGAKAHAEHQDDHHEGEHHGAEAHAGHSEHGEEEHSDWLHSLGAAVGVLGGLLLFTGHLLNIRASRSVNSKKNQSDVDAPVEMT